MCLSFLEGEHRAVRAIVLNRIDDTCTITYFTADEQHRKKTKNQIFEHYN